jgi:molecular chaperone HscC
MMNVPRAPAGNIVVELRFTYDINGILEVDATCKQTCETQTKLILTNKNISQEELAIRRKELQKLKISPRDQDENRFLLEWGARLYEECTGITREIVQAEMNLFVSVLAQNHIGEIGKARQRFTQFLEQQEDDNYGLSGGYER